MIFVEARCSYSKNGVIMAGVRSNADFLHKLGILHTLHFPKSGDDNFIF